VLIYFDAYRVWRAPVWSGMSRRGSARYGMVRFGGLGRGLFYEKVQILHEEEQIRCMRRMLGERQEMKMSIFSSKCPFWNVCPLLTKSVYCLDCGGEGCGKYYEFCEIEEKNKKFMKKRRK